MPNDCYNGMEEVRRNFETSEMPLPREEPQSYMTESDDARLSNSTLNALDDNRRASSLKA